MNAIATTELDRPATARSRTIAWFPVVVLGLVWLEVVSRLRLEWSINPQYSYGWAVPFLAAYIFWRRWQSAPAASAPRAPFLWSAALVLAASVTVPVRLVVEANPDWRLLSWVLALCAVAASAAAVYLAGGMTWLRHFAFGPLEWLWRSLTYLRSLSMRRSADLGTPPLEREFLLP